MKSFENLGLSQSSLNVLKHKGFEAPTPIQEKAIPAMLHSNKDIVGQAQTGTGKTAAFGLPILHQLKSRGRTLQSIILCPTRELWLQISQGVKKYAQNLQGVRITPVYGGERIDI